MSETDRLGEDEMVDILEDIARNSRSGTARIAAIRELRAWRAGEKPQEDTIAQLYEIGKPDRLRSKAA